MPCKVREFTLDTFTQSYLETALWSETGEDGTPLDDIYEMSDLSDETLKEAIEDCEAFQRDHAADLSTRHNGDLYGGHDFLLTRNRHGAGFWDGDWDGGPGKRLTDASHVYGSFHLYVGDDGRIYHHG